MVVSLDVMLEDESIDLMMFCIPNFGSEIFEKYRGLAEIDGEILMVLWKISFLC